MIFAKKLTGTNIQAVPSDHGSVSVPPIFSTTVRECVEMLWPDESPFHHSVTCEAASQKNVIAYDDIDTRPITTSDDV